MGKKMILITGGCRSGKSRFALDYANQYFSKKLYLALDSMQDQSILRSLILMTVMGRNAMVLVCFRSPYARSDEGLAKPFAENLRAHEIAWSFVLALGIALLTTGLKGIVVFLGICLFSLGYRLFFLKRLKGVTGDVLGAANEMVELLCLILLIISEQIHIG